MADEKDDKAKAAPNSEDSSATDAGSGIGEGSSSESAPKPSPGDETETTARTAGQTPPPSSPPPGKKSAGGGNKKVKIHFVAVGSAPLMKKTKFAIGPDQRFSSVVAFLRKMLKLGNSGSSSLFLYVNSAFVPSLDELVGDLNECFSVRGELVVHYSLQEAWG